MDAAFQTHVLTDDGLTKARNLAQDFNALLDRVKEVVPDGRELAIVRTKLEEACFFAKKGLAQKNGSPA